MSDDQDDSEPDGEMEPAGRQSDGHAQRGDNSDEEMARFMASSLRHAADTLEQVPEFYAEFRRGDTDFVELMNKLMDYDPDEMEIMNELIEQYGPPPGDPPLEP